MKVRAYWNLHKHLYSVQTYVKGKGWCVTNHVSELFLTNVTSKVNQKGIDRIREKKQKEVVAKLQGFLIDQPKQIEHKGIIYFNPYKIRYFAAITEDGKSQHLDNLGATLHLTITDNRPSMFII